MSSKKSPSPSPNPKLDWLRAMHRGTYARLAGAAARHLDTAGDAILEPDGRTVDEDLARRRGRPPGGCGGGWHGARVGEGSERHHERGGQVGEHRRHLARWRRRQRLGGQGYPTQLGRRMVRLTRTPVGVSPTRSGATRAKNAALGMVSRANHVSSPLRWGHFQRGGASGPLSLCG